VKASSVANTARALGEFAAKQGDMDLRFTPSPTSQQGINGWQAVAASRIAPHENSYKAGRATDADNNGGRCRRSSQL